MAEMMILGPWNVFDVILPYSLHNTAIQRGGYERIILSTFQGAMGMILLISKRAV